MSITGWPIVVVYSKRSRWRERLTSCSVTSFKPINRRESVHEKAALSACAHLLNIVPMSSSHLSNFNVGRSITPLLFEFSLFWLEKQQFFSQQPCINWLLSQVDDSVTFGKNKKSDCREFVKHYFFRIKTSASPRKSLISTMETLRRWFQCWKTDLTEFRYYSTSTSDAERSGLPIEITMPETIEKSKTWWWPIGDWKCARSWKSYAYHMT